MQCDLHLEVPWQELCTQQDVTPADSGMPCSHPLWPLVCHIYRLPCLDTISRLQSFCYDVRKIYIIISYGSTKEMPLGWQSCGPCSFCGIVIEMSMLGKPCMSVCVAVHVHYVKHCCPMSHGRVVGDPCLNGL